MLQHRRLHASSLVAFAIATVVVASLGQAGQRALTFEELMKFQQIRDATMSRHGGWIAYSLVPDRGDGECVLRSTTSDTEYRIERGSAPEITADERWAVAAISPTLEERESAKKKKKGDKGSDDDDKPKKGLSILDLGNGEEERIGNVEDFAVSEDGRWLAYRRYKAKDEPEKAKDEETAAEEPAEGAEKAPDDGEKKKEELGTTLELRDLHSGDEITVEHVSHFAFAENASILAYAISAPDGEGNGAFVRDLRADGAPARALHSTPRGRYTHLSWAREEEHLAFVAAVVDDDGDAGDAEVWLWSGSGEGRRVAAREDAPEGYTVPSTNELHWSRDGRRLFFGFKPVGEEDDKSQGDEEDGETPFEPYDLDAILDQRKVDVWHWNDPRIMPNQKERWEEHEKDRVFRAVVHAESGKVVPLADSELPDVAPSDSSSFVLGRSSLPYLREMTWDGEYFDLFAVSLTSGDRQLVAERIAGGRRWNNGSLSPNGRFVLFFDAGDWHLYDVTTVGTRNVTADLGVPFANEDHDYPSDPPGYGHSEWLADSSAVLVYDKFDIWRVFTDGRAPSLLTAGQGREKHVVFRVIDLDPEEEVIAPTAELLVSGYDDRAKHDAWFAVPLAGGAMGSLCGSERHRLSFVAKAEAADRVVFTRERYDEFPDLWVSNLELEKPTRLSDVNPQIADYAWGEAELVEWSSADGVPLQGILIKPGDYQPGTRYPVLVYFYRFFSQRLNLFNEPVVNHRPSFPIYASSGYAVFLPDIRFEIGQPGFSATKCLVPGIQKLVDMGVADPDAIGLHGHSWSGYQTAFVVTQTDIFAAAVAGAPVTNMTSAYSGIRWGTGLARQFQYEKSQSRIGGSLWEYPERYIENSPVFFADRIDTPLLIQFGDEDGAVPWYQGIELYLACRRLDKNCIMLQYRGEPHHLKEYANKLDYSIKMKQFFDHHLKGEAAPGWMTEGVPYRGE